jgi:hypothetical protein
MKILSVLLPLALLHNLATAAPLSQEFQFEDDMSPHEAGVALASLEKRASCQAILGTVYATVSSAALYVNSADPHLTGCMMS